MESTIAICTAAVLSGLLLYKVCFGMTYKALGIAAILVMAVALGLILIPGMAD